MEDYRDALGVPGPPDLVSRGLDDGKEWLSRKAEAPLSVIDCPGNVGRPGLFVDLCNAIEELPEQRMVFFNCAGVGVLFGEEDKGGVWTQGASLWKVVSKTICKVADVPGVREVVGVDEDVDLVICLEALGGVDAREDEFLIEEDPDIVIIRSTLPCTLRVKFGNLRTTEFISFWTSLYPYVVIPSQGLCWC